MRTPRIFALHVLSALFLAVAIPASAQIVGASDIIVGRVIGPDSNPVAGARVSIVSIATNATKNVVTNSDGRFTVLFRDGGGQYRLTATFLGLRPTTLTLQRRRDTDRFTVTVYMGSNPQQLSTVEVRGSADAILERTFGAGGIERTFAPQLLERLPVRPGDLFGAATLVPGVIATAASDTSRAAFSVAAQTSTQNNITVDGMTFLFGSIPQDAVRSTRVILNAYDVSRGQFTGGQLATTTKSGTRTFQGTANLTGRTAAMQFAGNRRDAFAQKYSQGLISTGFGGPFGRSERAFYFLAGELENRADAVLSLSSAYDPTLAKLGVSPDSLDRFYQALSSIGASALDASPRERTVTSGSGLGRVDVDINDANQLMLRADFRGSQLDGSRITPYAIPSTGGTTDGIGGGGMATLVSAMGKFINEARAYSSWEREDSDPYVRLPGGMVTIASTLEGRREVSSPQFGGNQFLPRTSRSTLQEASDELSWIAEDGVHRIKLGILVNRERAEITGVDNPYGVFVYNSLADLENNTPALYARTLRGSGRLIGTDNGALWISHGWRKTRALQVTYGARLEASRLAESPQLNPLVGAAFDRSTHGFLNEFHVSPRLGLTYLIGNVAGAPSGAFSLGFGEFRGRIPSHLLQYVNTNAGFANSDSQFVCVGSAVPSANWSAYRTDSLNIPSKCSGTSRLPIGTTGSNVAFWGHGAGAPRVWRTALSLEKRVHPRYGLGIDALYAHGVHNPAAADLNLVPAPLFTLGNEPRPVFAHWAAIVEPTGAVSLSASRQYPFFATAFDLGSGVSSRTFQLTAQLRGGGSSWRSATIPHFNVGYTLMRARDQSNGFPFANDLANTAGDPRRNEWGTSDLERRHSFLATGLLAFPHSLELGVVARALSGARYTPMVNGDVNGDGIRNDRAFIFSTIVLASPGVSDTAVINGMQRLLASSDGRTRDCLTAQTGRIAARNSCTTSWYPLLDLQLNWRPPGTWLDRRLTVSLVALNTLAGVDRILHGAGRMKGWGQPSFPDRTLLNVTGFDSTARTFKYAVNEHFGNRSGAANPFRVPFQFGLQMNLQLGADPQRETLRNVYELPGATGEDKPSTIRDLKARIYLNFPLPIAMTLAEADSLELNLTAEQLARLHVLDDSIRAQADTIVGAIAEILWSAGPNPDPGAVAPKLAKTQPEALGLIQNSAAALESILTPQQWALLPGRIKFPLRAQVPSRPERPPQ